MFRTKLVLALMGVVVAVTGAMLVTTQRRLLDGYSQLLRSEFQRQLDYHLALQADRLADVKQLGDELAAWAGESSRGRTNILLELRPALPDTSGVASPRDRLRLVPTLLSTNAGFLELLWRVAPDARRAGFRGRDPWGEPGREPGGGVGGGPGSRIGGGLASVMGGGPGGGPGSGPAGGPSSTPRLQRGGFLLVLDASGEQILVVPPDRGQPFGQKDPQVVERRRDFARQAIAGSISQQVGCLALPAASGWGPPQGQNLLYPTLGSGGEGNEVLYELVFNRVVHPENQELLGAFVVGVPMPDLLQRPPARPGGSSTNIAAPLFLSGMWVGADFYADPDDVPRGLAEALGEQLQKRFGAAPRNADEFVFRHGVRTYSVFGRLLNPESAFPSAYQVCLYSLDQAMAEQRALRGQVLGAGGGALLLALVLSWIIAHNLSVPIRALVESTGLVRQGNFEARVPVRRSDELGVLAASFNEMAAGLAQKERYRTILNMVADEKVAQRLVDGGLALGGEERDVTVLFCDIRGFTGYTQNMSPSDVIGVLNEHMTALTWVVKAHEGVLDKFVGDLLMALFGAPITRTNDCLNAARCALALLAERRRLNQTSSHRLDVGISLATGRVVAGCMGSAERLNYTVLGQRVNLASRLCDLAAPGEILIDETTRQRLSRLVAVEARPPVILEGFTQPVPVWRLLEVT